MTNRGNADRRTALYGASDDGDQRLDRAVSEPRGEQGFAVAPRRLGGGDPGRGRRRSLAIAVVAAVAVAIVGVGLIGPRLTDRPALDLSFLATPRPAATASPSIATTPVPGRTALPAVTRPEGRPTPGHVAYATDALHVLDLATGTNTLGPQAVFGRDGVFATPGGDGWTCICFDEPATAGGLRRTVTIIEVNGSGEIAMSTEVASFATTPPTDIRPPDVQTDVELLPGKKQALIAVSRRTADAWRFSIVPVDLVQRRAQRAVDVGDAVAPAPEPAPSATVDPGLEPAPSTELPAAGLTDLFLDGPHIRIDPTGRVAFVWGIVQRSGADAITATEVAAWRVAIGPDGSIGDVQPAPGFEGLPAFCGAIGFAAADRLAWLCPNIAFTPTAETSRAWRVGTIDLDGRSAGQSSFDTPGPVFGLEPLFDRANGHLYFWDPSNLAMLRIDAHSLQQTQVIFDPAARSAAGTEPGGSAKPDWADADSLVQMLGFSSVVGSPDGSRLYAVGFDSQSTVEAISQASLGIFVIDRSTLALVDRWAPAADYIGLAMTPDGLVAAAGMPGIDDRGREAPWESSLTLHDPVDGRILVRFGDLGRDLPPVIVDR